MNPVDLIQATGVAASVLVPVFGAVAGVRRFLHICQPNEVLIFSGRNRTGGDGRKVGYRVVFGGRSFRMPLVERVDRMDLSLISVPMQVRGAYSEGGIPLSLHAIANVKVSSDPRVVGNAIERFLGQSREEIARVAKETLEGHLRGVLATMTPEEVNEDRLKFADRLTEEAGPDLRKLGLTLDTLKIQQVGDDRNYLDSIGRTRIAEIVRDAEVAESDAVRAAEEAEAAAHARGGVAQQHARARVAAKENELRAVKAELWAVVRSEVERAEQAAAAARAEAEMELQRLRDEVETLRLAADVTIPADIARREQELLAAGEAAATKENGRAMAEALTLVGDAWRECGDRAMDMVVLSHLEQLVAGVSKATAAAHASEVAVLDGGDGRAVAGYLGSYPATVSTLLEQVGDTLGVDVRRVLRAEPRRAETTPPPALDVEAA